MRIQVVTIFPELFTPFLATSLVGRGIEQGLFEVTVHDLRDFTDDRHRSVDDEPYGGGGGMVMTAPPWLAAVNTLSTPSTHRVLMSPQGTRLDEGVVRRLAKTDDLLLMCGRYEGLDERVRALAVDEEVSIGDFVLAGGEVAAMVVVEALSRQIPGVVGLSDSVENDSFRAGLLDHPHYTRPRACDGLGVPDVLLSGNHAQIQTWRRREALRATQQKRPDLLDEVRLDATDKAWLSQLTARAGGATEDQGCNVHKRTE